ncbi:EF-hand domain-containing family member C2 [Phascolarctos cinereus]|uniref:EF-hand domain-containing family member C2 n=1 Tax=Phascolarctos cinereus TaxID=38626 RepID=A0A6P5L0E8_PHACI|nr:EF-hand domain-containing family member C2 isoform X2 [Phascolarctos cinereus]
MSLPLLPGYSFNKNLGKEKFHKSQHWGFCNHVGMLVNEDKPGIGGEPLFGRYLKPKYSVFPRGLGSDAPSWVAFDKQVLSFDAYFEDEVPEKNQELYRIRHCKIYFYLEDDTIQVVEPQLKNSGMPQGTFIRRHRIPLPPPNEDQFYTIHDFNINIDIVLYSRVFKIYNCDQFTKNFLRKMGVVVNPPGCCPADPYMKERKKTLDRMNPFRPYERFDTLRQFLEHDGHVLRFYCLWDDSESMFGDPRELVLHYFLSDDTIEVKEVIPANSGRDAIPLFLNRRKLPKFAPTGIYHPGQITDRTILNVFGELVGNRGRCLLDNCKIGALKQEFYKAEDLKIGTIINIWGRKVLLCDCDEFTKQYYKTKYGVVDFTPIPYKNPPPPKVEKTFPPYHGYGSEEDSLCSCLGLMPKPPQKDFKKFMEKDSFGLVSHVLRFLAKLDTEDCVDKDRRFIISYYLSDDTLSVYEPRMRNSGVLGGKFLERGRIKKPGQLLFKSEPSEFYKAQDLFVGAHVCFNGHVFILLNGDEYAFTYMEQHADEFPMSNIEIILKKLKAIGSPSAREIKLVFASTDPKHTKVLDYETFRDVMMNITNGKLTEHEIMTIGRYYSVREDSDADLTFLLALAQEQLKKYTFEVFDKMIAMCIYKDQAKIGLLPSSAVRTLCKSFRMPVSDDLLRALLSKFGDSQEQIDYRKFFCAVNWRVNQVPPFQALTCPNNEDVWNYVAPPLPVKCVRYLPLLADLFGLEDQS